MHRNGAQVGARECIMEFDCVMGAGTESAWGNGKCNE